VITINAGHGTNGCTAVKTLCHPDGSPKVTGGSTGSGATYATAIAYGTTMLDGTPEATVTLKLAMILKDRLLEAGFSVLMIRESGDTQLDNIARTVFANQNSDCHIALHYDSTTTNKGFFYIGVPNIASYRNMEPVKSHWRAHEALGQSLLKGMRSNGVKIWSSGNLPLDLTQTSYSTVPSVDIEVGDRASDYSTATLNKLADAIVDGVENYFGVKYP
jgi:N-acetylmuramoyl-L-alanine amidase